MNMLVWLGLREYASEVPAAKAAMADLAAQSEATFLVEWVPNHRVMENFNSVTGEGRDVPSPSNKYRGRVCKNIETAEMTGFYHTIRNSF